MVDRGTESLCKCLPRRGSRYDSTRNFHEQTGDPLPAYVVGDYVVEKGRRDWNFRVAGQYVGSWTGAKEWWEVRRRASRARPPHTVGPVLYTGNTLRECLRWIGEQA